MGELPFGIFSGIAHFRFNALLLASLRRAFKTKESLYLGKNILGI